MTHHFTDNNRWKTLMVVTGHHWALISKTTLKFSPKPQNSFLFLVFTAEHIQHKRNGVIKLCFFFPRFITQNPTKQSFIKFQKHARSSSMELLADLSWDSIANRDNREESLECEFMDELVQLVDRDRQSLELNDLLQCRMALWIPSAWSNSESSLRFTGGATAIAAVADLLLPRCLHTTRMPAGIFPCFSFLGEYIDSAGDDVGDAIGKSPETFSLSPYLLETFKYRGLISFRYLFITSFENRSVFESSELWFCNLLPFFLELFSLVSLQGFEASLNLTSGFFCFWVCIKMLESVSSVFFVEADLGFLKIETPNIGVDLSSAIGDWGLEMGSIGRIFLWEIESERVGSVLSSFE